MQTLLWITITGLLMSAIALVGSITLFLSKETLDRIILPLIAFAAGTLIGGAFFYMIPAGINEIGNDIIFYVFLVSGFTAFFLLEQLLHWHHCKKADADCKQPLGYMILFADGLHNFIGGLAIASTFLVDIKLGLAAWLAAAAHEVPQELGDFGVLIKSGWSKKNALIFNVISGISFLIGGLVTYFLSFNINMSFLIPFAAGNFIYIGSTDLIPEIKYHENPSSNIIHSLAFIFGLVLMFLIKLGFEN